MNNVLICPRCSQNDLLPVTAWRCPRCYGPLDWPGPHSFSRRDIDPGSHFVWRFGPALPVSNPSISFGERETPLTDIRIGATTLLAKLDFVTPTGSFKDRGFAVLLNALATAGTSEVIEDSSGNAAASIAAYAARGGIPCTVFAPAAASPAKLIQADAFGAAVVRVDGSRAAVAQAAESRHDAAGGAVYASHNWHPLFIAGVSTLALEVWEQLDFRVPDTVIAPAGSGSVILGSFRAFSQLQRGGATHVMPRLYAAQPDVCAPVAAAYAAGAETVEPVAGGRTIAEGASIVAPVRGNQVLHAVRSSGGGAVAVPEDRIVQATLDSAAQGIYIEPTSALAVAAAGMLLKSGEIRSSETTVLVLTGSGLKAGAAIEQAVASRAS